MDQSALDAFHGELIQTSPSLDFLLAEDSPLSTVDTVGTGTTSNTESSGPDFTNGTPSWNDTASLNNMLSENALESINRQRSQNKLIHLDPIPDFQDRNEIKPWLQKIFYPQGIEIVIERSDNIKVVFKCKASKRGRASRKQAGCGSLPEEKENPESPLAVKRVQQANKKKRSVSPYNTCPFRVRATYSLKRKKWNIVVMNNGHSHPLKFNADSDDYKKFKNYLRENEDWDAVKKFDELECRTRFNLPTQPQPIPCDCGLTQEIESFNIVLPTSDSLANSTDKTVSKPRHKSTRKGNKQMATALSRNSTPLGFLDKSPSQSARSGQEPQRIKQESTGAPQEPHSGMTGLSPMQNLDTSMSGWDPNTLTSQSEEIDFTDLFLRPLPRTKQDPIFEKPQTLNSPGRDQPWNASKNFMDDLQFQLAPVCEPSHTSNAHCILPSSTEAHMNCDAMDAGSQHEFPHHRVQQQDPSMPHSSPANGMLSSDLGNMHLTGQQMQVPHPDPGLPWEPQHSNDPHGYSNDF